MGACDCGGSLLKRTTSNDASTLTSPLASGGAEFAADFCFQEPIISLEEGQISSHLLPREVFPVSREFQKRPAPAGEPADVTKALALFFESSQRGVCVLG